MKTIIKNKFLLRKGLFALLFSCSAMVSATAEEMSTLFINLKDGSKVQFVLPTQKPDVSFSNSMMEVKYRENDQIGRLTFERDQVASLTVGTEGESAIKAVTANEKPRIHFDLTRPAVVRVSGMEQGDRLQVFGLDGKRIQADVSTTDGEATVNLGQQPSGVYVVSVNKSFTFKLIKP